VVFLVYLRKLSFFVLFLLFTVQSFGKTDVLFSPDDKPSQKLIELLNNAKSRIFAAVYMITDKRIADALISAKNNRKVDVQIITDSSCLKSDYGKIDKLKENNINVFVFSSDKKSNLMSEPLMHNKFALIDNKVWTGSFNWTRSADHSNQENVVIMDKQKIVSRYEKQFEKLKSRCVHQKSNKVKTSFSQNSWDSKEKSYYFFLRNKIISLLRGIKARTTID